MSAGRKQEAVGKLVGVRIRPGHSLSVVDGAETSHHVAGDELQLPEDAARQLIADGFVERVQH